MLRKERVYLFMGVLAAELVIFFAAAAYPLDPAAQKIALDQANSTLAHEGSLGPTGLFGLIFTNNIRIAVIEMAPVLGGIFFVVSILTTGEVIQALATSQGHPSLTYAVILFLYPFTILELGAYAFASSSGIMLLVSTARRRLRHETKLFFAEILVVVGTTAVAAAMETLTILVWWVGLLLWIPVGIAVIWVSSRLRRQAPKETPSSPAPIAAS